MHHLLLPMSSRDRRAFGTICPSALLTTTQMTSLHSSLWNAPVIPTSVKLGHQLGGAIISGSGEPCVVQPVHDRNHPRGPTLHDFSQPQIRVPSTHYIGGPSQLSLDDTHSPSRLFLRTHAHSQPMCPRACPLQSLSLFLHIFPLRHMSRHSLARLSFTTSDDSPHSALHVARSTARLSLGRVGAKRSQRCASHTAILQQITIVIFMNMSMYYASSNFMLSDHSQLPCCFHLWCISIDPQSRGVYSSARECL